MTIESSSALSGALSHNAMCQCWPLKWGKGKALEQSL